MKNKTSRIVILFFVALVSRSYTAASGTAHRHKKHKKASAAPLTFESCFLRNSVKFPGTAYYETIIKSEWADKGTPLFCVGFVSSPHAELTTKAAQMLLSKPLHALSGKKLSKALGDIRVALMAEKVPLAHILEIDFKLGFYSGDYAVKTGSSGKWASCEKDVYLKGMGSYITNRLDAQGIPITMVPSKVAAALCMFKPQEKGKQALGLLHEHVLQSGEVQHDAPVLHFKASTFGTFVDQLYKEHSCARPNYFR